MLTTGFVGCMPVSAEDAVENSTDTLISPLSTPPTGYYITFNYLSCHTDSGNRHGLYLQDVQYTYPGKEEHLINYAYQTGIRFTYFTGSQSYTQIWLLSGMSCSSNTWTDSTGWHLSNTFTKTNAITSLTYIAEVAINTGIIYFKNSFSWSQVGSNVVTNINVWWKMEFQLGSPTTENRVFFKNSAGNWIYLQQEATGIADSSHWLSQKVIHFATLHLFYILNHVTTATTTEKWAAFKPLLYDYSDFEINDNDESLILQKIIGAEYTFQNAPSQGTTYWSWAEWQYIP
jgi:hypothetical protein